MKKELINFIDENIDEILITGGIEEDTINEIEQQLGIELNEQYREFLKRYGMLLGYGIEILGVGKSNISTVTKATMRYRDFGLEKGYIIIQDEGELVYCLNLDKESDYFQNILNWERNSKQYIVVSESFEEHLYDLLVESKESWEEDM